MRGVLVVGVVALMVVGCSDDDDDGGSDVQAIELGGTSWVLDTLDGQSPVTDGIPTLDFGADGAVSGTTGCNQFAGTYETEGADLTIEIGPLTLAACSDELEAQQQSLLDAFAATTFFSGGQESFLELIDADGGVLATFAPSGL
jgi:heat shock protein HslJ